MDDYAQLVLKKAIAAAKAGQRAYARELLLELVETEPENELAWLWLSSLQPTLGEQIAALETVLRFNPAQHKAQQRLAQLKAHQSALQVEQQKTFAELLQTVQRLMAGGQKAEARELLLQLVDEDEKNETAWWLLSELVEDVQDEIVALENVLILNPSHAQAKFRLKEKQQLQQDDLALGLYYEGKMLWAKAANAYGRAAADGLTPATRREATLRQKAAELELTYPGILTIRSTATWLRLMAGPPLLYSLLVFIHLGLQPTYLSLPFCFGFAGVLAGSVLLVGVQNVPLNPLWHTLFGSVGLSRPYAHFLFWCTGLLLTFLPFFILFVGAILRLQALALP